MATGDMERGPTGQRVAEQVRSYRDERRMSLDDLTDRLKAEGQPILPSGLSKLERGIRRVDVDDLMALAIALGVTPNLLLLPAVDGDVEAPVRLTPATEVSVGRAWRWLNGILPLSKGQQLIDSSISLNESIRWADALRPIADAIRAAREAGVPLGKVHAWAERVVMEEAIREADDGS